MSFKELKSLRNYSWGEKKTHLCSRSNSQFLWSSCRGNLPHNEVLSCDQVVSLSQSLYPFRLVCLFLKRGADYNAKDKNQKDPITIAVDNANADIVTL